LDSELKPSDLNEKIEYIKRFSVNIDVPTFVPKKVNITTDESVMEEEPSEYTDEDEQEIQRILSKLGDPSEYKDKLMNVITFEKDNDQNFHVDVIASSANLRAFQYNIKTASKLEAKLIAGKIVPAIVTTTAVVVGFACLELYKLVAGKDTLGDFRNTFVNLALPLVQQGEPIKPKSIDFCGKPFSLWDRIDIRIGDATLQDVLKWFEENYDVTLEMLGIGSSLIYTSWALSKAKERLPQKLTDLYEKITKKKIDPEQKFFMLEPNGVDKDGNEIEFPLVAFWFKN
jgi:ubiquitin-activating enzyme E1